VRPGSRFDSTSEEAERATPLPGWVQDLIRAGLRHFEQIIDIRFVEVQETSNQVGVLRFSGLEGSHPDMAAFAFMPSVGPWGGDVFFYEDHLLESNLDYLQSTILHEIGHALGLKHPFEAESYNSVVLSPERDQVTLTLMSYTDVAGQEDVFLLDYPETLMPLDILALQRMYGPSRLSSGDTLYDLSRTEFDGFHALFDAGGIDTLDASRLKRPVNLSLQEAVWSDIGARVMLSNDTFYSNTLMLVQTQIERVEGTAFNDRMEGNAADNQFAGGPGTDEVRWAGPLSRFELRFIDGSWVVKDQAGTFGTDTVSGVERLAFSDRTLLIESRPHESFDSIPEALYQFFIVAFNAAPGVTYMEQLSEAYRFGMSVQEIVGVFITKPQFTDVYPTSLSSAELSVRLVNNIVGDSASQAVRQEAIRDLQDALDYGLTRGDVIYRVFGNLAKMPFTDAKWGEIALLFANQILAAKAFTEGMDQSTTELETLRSALSAVTGEALIQSEQEAIEIVIEGLTSAGSTPLGPTTLLAAQNEQTATNWVEREWMFPPLWPDPIPFA
jgi:hypothetical protein